MSAVVLLPGLVIGPSLDAAVFVQVADRVTHGAALYTDTWDHKPPGVYLLLAGLQVLVPVLKTWPIAWAATVGATAGAGTALVAGLRGLGMSLPVSVVAGAAAVLAMGQYLLSLGGGLTESLATLPLAGALAVSLAPGGRYLVRGSAVGLLLATALLLSLQVAAGPVALAALMVWRAGQGLRLRVAGSLLLGGLVPLVVVPSWLALSGNLQAAVDAVIGYSVAYRDVEAPGGQLFSPLAAWTTLALLFLIVPAVMGGARMLRMPGSWRAVGVTCLAWLGLGIGLFVYQGRFYGHYAIPLVLPLAILAGPGIARAFGARPGSWRVRVARLAPFVIGAVVSLLAGVASARMEAEAIGAINARSRAVAEIMRGTVERAGAVWVWGNAPQVYVHAERSQATAYSYLYPLVTPGYSTPLQVQAVVANLEADPPAVVVDAGSASPGAPGFLPLLIPRPVASDGRNLDILDPLRAFVADGYELDRIVAGWVLYVRR
jgi:hypothetical protein